MKLEKAYRQAIDEYGLRTRKSGQAYEAARKYIAGGETRSVSYYRPYPLTIDKAAGCRIRDIDENEYIDFISNYTSMIHGHAHPAIVTAVQTAIAAGTGHPAGMTEQLELARILCERLPSVEQIRFCNSGTEATMFVVRAARAFTGRDGLIKMEGGYHGTTDLVEYNVHPPLSSDGQAATVPIPSTVGIAKSAGRDLFIARFNDLNSVEKILKEHGKEIAAILVEPVMGAAGVIPPLPGYLAGLRRLADQYDVLLIFDEIQTLRLALGGAQEKYRVIPDLTAVAKIIGGGFPVGGFGGRADIMAVFDPRVEGHLSQSGTFNGNRISMAAGVASMKLLDAKAIDRLEALSIRLENGITRTIKLLGVPVSLTRAGSLLNVHFKAEPPVDYATARNQYPNMAKLYHLAMLKRGIFCAPRGTLVVSTVMTGKEIDYAVEAFADVMETMAYLF